MAVVLEMEKNEDVREDPYEPNDKGCMLIH